jgi:hypothetical protein
MAAPSELVGAIDELARNDLQGSRDWYFGWLRISTTVVAVGVILEEADEFPFRKHRFVISRGDLVPRYRLIHCLKWIAKIGWFLIIVGVIGEGIFESFVSKTD